MKENTKTTAKKQSKDSSKDRLVVAAEHAETEVIAMGHTKRDFLNALLVTSLTINVIVLITWLVTQVTFAYHAEIAALLNL